MALRKIQRMLKQGGKFVVMVDLWRWHWGRMREGRVAQVKFIELSEMRLLGRKALVFFGESYFLRHLFRPSFEFHHTGTKRTVEFVSTRASMDMLFIPESDSARPRIFESAA